MASDEEEDLAALRSAVFASLLQPKATATVIQKDNRLPSPQKSEDEDEDDLAALRAAALQSKRKKSQEGRHESRRNTSDRRHERSSGGRSRSNVITIPSESSSTKRPPVRPQDNWGGSLQSSPSSTPPRPKMGRKFSRLERSDSESEESADEANLTSKRSDDELGSDVDIQLGFGVKDISPAKPPPAVVPVRARSPSPPPAPVMIKAEPEERVDEIRPNYQDIDERHYNQRQNDLSLVSTRTNFVRPVVVDEHGDVDMRRVETQIPTAQISPPKLQIQVNMDGGGDRRRVHVADDRRRQQMFRVTVSNLNQQRNILIEENSEMLYQDQLELRRPARITEAPPVLLDRSRMLPPPVEPARIKPESEPSRPRPSWDTQEQFRNKPPEVVPTDTWNSMDSFHVIHKPVSIETSRFAPQKAPSKLYMDCETPKPYIDRGKPPKYVEDISDSESKTDSIVPSDSVSNREHDAQSAAEYWVTNDDVTERVIRREGKAKQKTTDVSKEKSRSPRERKTKVSKTSPRRRKPRPETESSLERYSEDDSDLTLREIKKERDDSCSDSGRLSPVDVSSSESDYSNDDSRFSDEISSVSNKQNHPVPYKKSRGPEHPARKKSGRSPTLGIDPRKNLSPKRKKGVQEEYVSDRVLNKYDKQVLDKAKVRDKHREHKRHALKEKNASPKASHFEQVQKYDRVEKSKVAYSEEPSRRRKSKAYDQDELQVRPHKIQVEHSRKSRTSYDDLQEPIKKQRKDPVDCSHVSKQTFLEDEPIAKQRKASQGSRDRNDKGYSPAKRGQQPDNTDFSPKNVKSVKRKATEPTIQVERNSRAKKRSPKKRSPLPVEPQRAAGERMYRARRQPEEEGEITDEEDEERVCKPVKMRNQQRMKEAINECIGKIQKLRREEKEEGELDESPVEVNRLPLKVREEEREEGELSEGPSEMKFKMAKARANEGGDDLEDRLASHKLQKLRKEKKIMETDVSDKEGDVSAADEKAKDDEKVTWDKSAVNQKSKILDGDKDSSKKLKGTASEAQGKTQGSETVLNAGNIPLPEPLKKGDAEKSVDGKLPKDGKKVGKAAAEKNDPYGKWRKIGEDEEDRSLSPLQEVLEEAEKAAEETDAKKVEASASGDGKDKDGGKFQKFQFEKPGVKKPKKGDENKAASLDKGKKLSELGGDKSKKLDKAGLKISETKERLMKILAEGKLKTQEAKVDPALKFSAGLEAIVSRKGVAEMRKKIAANKIEKKSLAKGKKESSESPVHRKRSYRKSSRSRRKESRSRSRSTSRSSYDHHKSRHRRRHRYSSSSTERTGRYSSSSYSRRRSRSRSRSRRRSYSRRRTRSRSRSTSYSRRRSRSGSRSRRRSRSRSGSRSKRRSRTRSSSHTSSRSSRSSRSSSHSTRSSSSESSASSSSSSSKESNAAWRFKHTGKSAQDTQTKSEIFERKRNDIEVEQKKRQLKSTVDKQLPDDRRGNNNRPNDRWRDGHDYRFNQDNYRDRFNDRPRFNQGFRGRYQRAWGPRGGSGFRDFRNYRDDNFRDNRNQNRDRDPIPRRRHSWSGDEEGGSPRQSRSKDKKEDANKSNRSKSRDDSKETDKRSQSHESGAQTLKTAANKTKTLPPKFDDGKESDQSKDKDKASTDSESLKGEANKDAKEKLPVHKRLGSQLGNVIPAKMGRQVQSSEPDNYRGQQQSPYVYRWQPPRVWGYPQRWRQHDFGPFHRIGYRSTWPRYDNRNPYFHRYCHWNPFHRYYNNHNRFCQNNYQNRRHMNFHNQQSGNQHYQDYRNNCQNDNRDRMDNRGGFFERNRFDNRDRGDMRDCPDDRNRFDNRDRGNIRQRLEIRDRRDGENDEDGDEERSGQDGSQSRRGSDTETAKEDD